MKKRTKTLLAITNCILTTCIAMTCWNHCTLQSNARENAANESNANIQKLTDALEHLLYEANNVSSIAKQKTSISKYNNVMSRSGRYIYGYSIPNGWSQDSFYKGKNENGINVYSSTNGLTCGDDKLEIRIYDAYPNGSISIQDSSGTVTEASDLEDYKKDFAEAQNNFYDTGTWTAPTETPDPALYGGPYYPSIQKENEIETPYGRGIIYTALCEYVYTSGETGIHVYTEGILIKAGNYFIDVQYVPISSSFYTIDGVNYSYNGTLVTQEGPYYEYTGKIQEIFTEMLETK